MSEFDDVTKTGKFDPETCVTAGELRALGCQIDETIPDCGWIEWGAWHVDEIGETTIREDGTLDVRFTFRPNKPFRWWQVTIPS